MNIKQQYAEGRHGFLFCRLLNYLCDVVFNFDSVTFNVIQSYCL